MAVHTSGIPVSVKNGTAVLQSGLAVQNRPEYSNDTARVIDICDSYADDRRFANILRNTDLFHNVKVSPGGNGIEWGEERFISAESLSQLGMKTEISYTDMLTFVEKRVVDTTETAGLLNCTRQYIGQLSSKGKLKPFKSGSNNSLFLKSEIERG